MVTKVMHIPDGPMNSRDTVSITYQTGKQDTYPASKSHAENLARNHGLAPVGRGLWVHPASERTCWDEIVGPDDDDECLGPEGDCALCLGARWSARTETGRHSPPDIPNPANGRA